MSSARKKKAAAKAAKAKGRRGGSPFVADDGPYAGDSYQPFGFAGGVGAPTLERSRGGSSSQNGRRPSINLNTVFPFGPGSHHQIGGPALGTQILDYWRGLQDQEKGAFFHVSDEDLVGALASINVIPSFTVMGEPSEEVAKEAAQGFLYGLEVADGLVPLPPDFTLEYMACLLALEHKLSLSMDIRNMQHDLFSSWLLLCWQSDYWWVYIACTLLLFVVDVKPVAWAREMVKRAIDLLFVQPSKGGRAPANTRWRCNTLMSALIGVCLARYSRGWFLGVVVLAVASFLVDLISRWVSGAEDKSQLRGIQNWMLYGQTILVLVLAFRAGAPLTFFVAALWWWPASLLLVASTTYFVVGLCMRLMWTLVHFPLSRMIPKPTQYKLERIWNSRPTQQLRAVMTVLLACLVPMYAWWVSRWWLYSWKRVVVRWLAVFVGPNIASIEDVEQLLRKGKELAMKALSWLSSALEWICTFVKKEWREYREEHGGRRKSSRSDASDNGG